MGRPTLFTDEEIVREARTFPDRIAWKKARKQQYEIAWSRGLLPLIYSFLPKGQRVREPMYSNDDLFALAHGCATRTEFQQKFRGAYMAARERGLLDSIWNFLPSGTGPVSAYSDEELLQDAKRFATRREWAAAGEDEVRQGKPSHHRVAFKRGGDFYRQCCVHMPDERGGSRGYTYSDDELLASARRFQTRGAWKNEAYNHYQTARLRPVWDECIEHMRPAANPFAKDYTIYAYEFSDGYAYVGLTVVPENRKMSHASRGPVFNHTRICPSPVYKTLITGLSFTEAIAAEGKWQAAYKEKGWLGLHKAKAGSLGSIKTASRWTKEAVMAEARKYKTKQEWIDGSQMSYRIAKREGWFDEACAHMPKRVLGIGAGVAKTPEAREKMRQAKLGKQHTPEMKAARSEATRKWWAARKAGPTVESAVRAMLDR